MKNYHSDNGIFTAAAFQTPSAWAFKIKRSPDGSISKHKARFCVRGDKQIEGVDVFETFAPAVAWPTARCLLAFTLKNHLATRQVDFSNAFVQSELPPGEQAFVEVPRDFRDPNGHDIVLKLNKSLHGMRSALFHWCNKIKASLEAHGFERSEDDYCLFHRKKDGLILLLYVDDVILFHKSDKIIDEFIEELRKEYKLTAEEIDQDAHRAVYQFLGIELIDQKQREPGTDSDTETAVQVNTSRSIMLRQTKLVDSILKTVHMVDCKPALCMDRDGAPFDEDWEYATVVGKLPSTLT